jgi:hypothetical protein
VPSVLAAIAASVLAFAGAGPAEAGTDLRIQVWSQGRNGPPTRTFTLRCDPTGGNLRDAAGACRRLAALRNPFAPPRQDVACTQIYGGPQEALITGRYRGRRVSTLLSLRDGCEIERWQRLAFLTPGFGTRGS